MPTYISTGFLTTGSPGASQRAARAVQTFVYIGGGRLVEYSPTTGAVQMNVSIAPLTTGTFYNDPNVLSVQTLGSGANTSYRLINWTIAGSSTNFTTRINSNVSYPFSSIGTADYEAGIAVNTLSTTSPATGTPTQTYIMAASLTTGKLLWNVSSGINVGLYYGTTAQADHGKYAARFNDGYIRCYDLNTGQALWKSESVNWPWGSWEVKLRRQPTVFSSTVDTTAFTVLTGQQVR